MTNANKPDQGASHVTDQPRWIEIFRAGTHTDMHGRKMEFTEAALQDVAAGYDPAVSEAPVVVGHPTTNGPAYGWVGQLKVEDGKLLYAERQSEPQFDAMRSEGRFKKRSASFFLPTAPNNPTPGKLYLRHVGWLGAAAPAVKGLKDPIFSDQGEGVIEFEDEGVSRWGWQALVRIVSRLRDETIARDGAEAGDRIFPEYEMDSLREAGLIRDSAIKGPLYADNATSDLPIDDIPPAAVADDARAADLAEKEIEVNDKTNTDFAEREQKLSARDLEIQEREKKLRDREAKVARDAAGDFADGLVTTGKLLPAQRAPVIELLLFAAAADNATLSFADGDEKIEQPAEEVLRNFLDSLPQQIDYAEKAGQRGEDTHNTSFAAPPGALVDPQQLEAHGKAKAYQVQHPNVSFVDAVKAVGG